MNLRHRKGRRKGCWNIRKEAKGRWWRSLPWVGTGRKWVGGSGLGSQRLGTPLWYSGGILCELETHRSWNHLDCWFTPSYWSLPPQVPQPCCPSFNSAIITLLKSQEFGHCSPAPGIMTGPPCHPCSPWFQSLLTGWGVMAGNSQSSFLQAALGMKMKARPTPGLVAK